MIPFEIEIGIVLLGWVIPLVLGLILLLLKQPQHLAHVHYVRGKNTCALAMIVFGLEILAQWIMRVTGLGNDVLSVSIYLLTFWITTMLNAVGFCTMLAQFYFDKRQRTIAVLSTACYVVLLVVIYLLPERRWQVIGLVVCSALLFIFMIVAIVKSVFVYRSVINDLRRYYSDLLEDIMRWIPGMGVGIILFHLAAPFVCFLPRPTGVYQVSLGIVMFIYSFACIVNFSFHYTKVATAVDKRPDEGAVALDDAHRQVIADRTPLSESLQQVIRDKLQRWVEQREYCTPGITIEQAARAMGTNRSYLSRYLNEVQQVSFYEWVAGLRVSDAQTLLLNERTASIEQIARQVGFTSQSTFSSTFKKVVSLSPVQWRNSH